MTVAFIQIFTDESHVSLSAEVFVCYALHIALLKFA